MRKMLRRLLSDDTGQDLVEYSLLVAFIGLAVLAAWLAMQNAIATGYISLDTREQTLSSTTPDPQ